MIKSEVKEVDYEHAALLCGWFFQNQSIKDGSLGGVISNS
jgi:hypothetical protein